MVNHRGPPDEKLSRHTARLVGKQPRDNLFIQVVGSSTSCLRKYSDLVFMVLLLAALGIIAWAAFWFFRKKTPIEPHHTPKTLIVEGPFRLTRNPIYLALVLLTLASAIGHGSVFGLVAAAALWWVLDRRFAAPEEALLLATFGAEAQEYLARSKRWL